jgi:hypothetical protein
MDAKAKSGHTSLEVIGFFGVAFLLGAIAFAWIFKGVSAATFNSNIVPSSTNTYSLGVSGSVWNNINNIIYFSGSNVGVGTTTPLAPLEVAGGDIFVDTAGNGITLRDPSGACWKVTVNGSGALSTASTSCATP